MIEIAPTEAGPGALLLFRMQPRAIAKHVGIVTDSRIGFIHAYERLGVIEEPLTPVWRRRVAFRLPVSADAGRAGVAPP